MIHDLPVVPYGGINMYSVCGFEVASANYSIGCEPALFEITSVIYSDRDILFFIFTVIYSYFNCERFVIENIVALCTKLIFINSTIYINNVRPSYA